jgi:hypothetical protein
MLLSIPFGKPQDLVGAEGFAPLLRSYHAWA